MSWTAKKRRAHRATMLRRLRTFCRVHGWWPSSRELGSYRGAGVAPATSWRTLKALEEAGLAQRVGRGSWAPTEAGFERIGAEPIVARLPGRPSKKGRRRARKRGRVAAAAVLDRLGLDVVE